MEPSEILLAIQAARLLMEMGIEAWQNYSQTHEMTIEQTTAYQAEMDKIFSQPHWQKSSLP
jgi:hypothetical protein